ncbi:apoptosis-enhancing nuclease [Brachyhypopomus gauderio]|uniref:apoptosis-enhancing nuclease n=1 Tax=Brachyhypopomus gauderio TaxID=698409 RepID=UPI0040411444
MESTIICSAIANTHKRRKLKKKKKNGFVDSNEMNRELKTCNKRTSSERLEEEDGGVSSSCDDRPVPSSSIQHANPPKRARTGAASPPDAWDVDSGFSSEMSPYTSGRNSPCVGVDPSMLVAIDCEMVGTGPGGKWSELARCSVVNYYGDVLYDKYVRPCQPVTDYRTRWSGIRKKHLVGALPFEEARKEIIQLLEGKVVVGHALHNDLRVLEITVPRHMVRDTSHMSLLRMMAGISGTCVSLKKLTSALLKRTIQVGQQGHCSVEDARAALDLYKLVEDEWEKSLPAQDYNFNLAPKPASSLEQYMQDCYWPDSITDCNQ